MRFFVPKATTHLSTLSPQDEDNVDHLNANLGGSSSYTLFPRCSPDPTSSQYAQASTLELVNLYQRVPNVTTKNASNSWIGMQNRFLTAPTTEFILLLCATFLLPSSNSSKEAINLPQTVTVSAATTVTTISQPSPCIHLAVICTYVLYSSGHAPGLKPTACRQPGASTRP